MMLLKLKKIVRFEIKLATQSVKKSWKWQCGMIFVTLVELVL